MMSLKYAPNKITVEDYLQGEILAEVKHELIDGEVYAMAGASKNHERIAGNVYRKIGNSLENSPCEPFSSDLKVKVGDDFFYPDVMVVCEDKTGNEYYTESPTLIVEVLSGSTRRMDETTKKIAYQSIPSLQEYMLIEQDFVDVELCSRNDGWQSRHYFLGDEVMLTSLSLTLTVEEIYQRVVNDDMVAYWRDKEKMKFEPPLSL
jgi:Uma2 family endonuclease